MSKSGFILILLLLLFYFSINVNTQEQKVRIDILYFHATLRCHGCLTIEEYLKNSVMTLYEKQLKDSTFTIQSLDFQQPENEHFQDDYNFDVQTLILSKKVNGKEVKWKNLDKIWDYSDYPNFKKYIEEEINNFIKE